MPGRGREQRSRWTGFAYWVTTLYLIVATTWILLLLLGWKQ
jgi:hypothetical protein